MCFYGGHSKNLFEKTIVTNFEMFINHYCGGPRVKLVSQTNIKIIEFKGYSMYHQCF